jgi:hypothetical protein
MTNGGLMKTPGEQATALSLTGTASRADAPENRMGRGQNGRPGSPGTNDARLFLASGDLNGPVDADVGEKRCRAEWHPGPL